MLRLLLLRRLGAGSLTFEVHGGADFWAEGVSASFAVSSRELSWAEKLARLVEARLEARGRSRASRTVPLPCM